MAREQNKINLVLSETKTFAFASTWSIFQDLKNKYKYDILPYSSITTSNEKPTSEVKRFQFILKWEITMSNYVIYFNAADMTVSTETNFWHLNLCISATQRTYK